MRAVLGLACQSAWARRVTLGITLVAIALSTALLLAVERVRHDARESFTHSIAGVHLIVGARTGSVQLMLYAVFHSGSATNNIGWDAFQSIASNPAVDWAIPLSLGDSHRGYPVLGTSSDYFRHLRYGDGRRLSFTAGRAFAGTVDGVFEAVLGSDVARQLKYRNGDRIVLTHGLADIGPEHADKPFVVVGILAPTGTPIDRTVHISLEAMTAIHVNWVGGAPIGGFSVPATQVRKFDLAPKEITAALLGLKRRTEVFRMQRTINNYRPEPLLAAMPGVALDELWQTVGFVEKTLFALSSIVVIVGLTGLMSTMLAGLDQRRREMAILRALGAGPRDIFAMLIAEGVIVTALGCLLGCLFLAFGIVSLQPLIQSQFGVVLSYAPPSANEYLILLSILATGLLSSLFPGWRAWRMSLADGLTPHQ